MRHRAATSMVCSNSIVCSDTGAVQCVHVGTHVCGHDACVLRQMIRDEAQDTTGGWQPVHAHRDVDVSVILISILPHLILYHGGYTVRHQQLTVYTLKDCIHHPHLCETWPCTCSLTCFSIVYIQTV